MRFPLMLALAPCALGLVYAQAPKPQDIKLRGDRFKPLSYGDLTPPQKTLIEDALKGAVPTVNGPYNILLRSPEMGDLAHQFGAYTRFRSTVPTKLNELGIIMAAKFWGSEFVWLAHKRAAVAAGLSLASADAIAQGKRPASLPPDEEAVYNFCDELLHKKQVGDATFKAAKDVLGEQGVVDLIGGMGYFQFVAMLLNVDRYPLPEGSKPELGN